MNSVIILLISAILSFSAGWQVQNWRFAAKEKEHETQRISELEQQRAADARQLAKLGAVQAQAETRALALRRAADNARAESIGLRDAIVALSAQPVADATASNQRAAAVGELLAECGDKYQALGAVADRHASDVKTLSEAWPE